MTSLSVEDHALAADIATEIVETAMDRPWMAFMGNWTEQVKRLYGMALSYPKEDQTLAEGRLVRIQAHVAGANTGGPLVLPDGCVEGHHPEWVSCELGSEWP